MAEKEVKSLEPTTPVQPVVDTPKTENGNGVEVKEHELLDKYKEEKPMPAVEAATPTSGVRVFLGGKPIKDGELEKVKRPKSILEDPNYHSAAETFDKTAVEQMKATLKAQVQDNSNGSFTVGEDKGSGPAKFLKIIITLIILAALGVLVFFILQDPQQVTDLLNKDLGEII